MCLCIFKKNRKIFNDDTINNHNKLVNNFLKQMIEEDNKQRELIGKNLDEITKLLEKIKTK